LQWGLALAKAVEAFRNIGEVSADLGVRKHVLRFWEAKFPQLKPMKRGGGRRYYRPADVQLLQGIRHLLQTAGYTIKGVQKILREGGAEDVKRLGKAQPTSRDERGGRVRPPAQPCGIDAPRQLTGMEVSALRSVMLELDALRALLAGAQPSESTNVRPKRVAARG
jgi:DNA-binding transcriptional MerR regulator